MGIVFRAIREDGAVVALKVIKPGLVADERTARRFAREARAAGEVDHPHLIDVLDAGDVDGVGYLAMHYVPDKSLDDRIRADGPLSVADTTRIVSQIASALDALHAAELVHRDVKPSNILLDEERGALLTDFGLAKRRDYSMLTAPGQMLGTLDYIAPEMLRGDEPGRAPTSTRSAAWSSSAWPASRRSGARACSRSGWPTSATCRRIRAPIAADAPPGLSEAVLAALAKEPSQRPSSATVYAEMLIGAARSG